MGKRDQRATNAAYYARFRQTELGRVRRRQAATLQLLQRIKSRPCLDCGGKFAPCQMDFDHRRPELKRFRLSSGTAMLASRARLDGEIAKCDIVCANCHRRRTHRAQRAIEFGGKSRHIARKRAYWHRQAELLRGVRDVPCGDCGKHLEWFVMDFDHREPSLKRLAVTRMVGRVGTSTLLKEVAKCDIVCANCHRARTERSRTERSLSGSSSAV